jgi:hypothetical protein
MSFCKRCATALPRHASLGDSAQIDARLPRIFCIGAVFSASIMASTTLFYSGRCKSTSLSKRTRCSMTEAIMLRGRKWLTRRLKPLALMIQKLFLSPTDPERVIDQQPVWPWHVPMSTGFTMRSGAKIVRYPDRSVDQRVHAFWHTLLAKMREQALALSYETFWPRGLQGRGGQGGDKLLPITRRRSSGRS